MKLGNVPTSRVGPVLERLIAERWPESLRNEDEAGGLEILAEKVGCDRDAIADIISQRHEGCGFDLIDRLLCALGRPDLWRGQLADVYLDMKFVTTCSAPACSKVFVERTPNGSKRKFCSRNCRVLAANVRRGRGTGLRLKARNRCMKGHLLTLDNVVRMRRSDGTFSRRCKTCRQAEQREAWRKKHGTIGRSDEVCANGHPREGNLFIKKSGARGCRACAAAADKRHRERRKLLVVA